MQANGLGPRERPRRGAELIVPAPARPRPKLVSFAGERRHWVQEGESVSTIARQYGVSVRALLLANQDLSQRPARVGARRGLRAGDDVLRLPAGSNPK